MNIYISDLTPETSFINYADDSALYSVLSKSKTTATHSTLHSVTSSIPSDNQLQQAANYAVDWCDTNRMLLDASKSNAILFSAQKKITASPLTIKDSKVAYDNSAKLL